MDTLKTNKGTELFLQNLKGKPYLPVAQRMVWFVEENPAYVTEVDFLKLDDEQTVAKVTIRVVDHSTKSVVKVVTDVKRETKKDFNDHTEKAVTGAFGRCLAQLGYGTAYAVADLDEGTRIVDAPVDMGNTNIKADSTPVAETKKTSTYRKPEYKQKEVKQEAEAEDTF